MGTVGGKFLQPRRQLLRFAGAAAVTSLLPSLARGLEFPTKALHGFVTTAPGGSSDLTTRLVTTPLAERLGQPVLAGC